MAEEAAGSTIVMPERGTRSSSRVSRAVPNQDSEAIAINGSSPNNPLSIPPEERWQAIAVTAYQLARASGFSGASVEYWLAAEAKFNAEAIR